MSIEDRYFDPNPTQKELALQLYRLVKQAPIISPHGHIDPGIFSNKDFRFANPVSAVFQTDHYILRMLYSQGFSYETFIENEDPREAWRVFAENFHLFRGTPSGLWITHMLEEVFGVREKLEIKSADRIYNQLQVQLSSDEFMPRNLFDRFNIEVLATTDEATSSLSHHQVISAVDWGGKIIPTFRPDQLFQLNLESWRNRVDQLAHLTDQVINCYSDFIKAIEKRRENFITYGATAVDIGVPTPRTTRLALPEVNRIFDAGLQGKAHSQDAALFSAHMLYEMARMSCDDGLALQIHFGIYRNHNDPIYKQFGKDMGFDIPMRVEFTENLRKMLNDFGNHPKFRLILFTLDESTYSRELAPLAGAYPCIKLGPPWWFLDSWNGMKRYFETVMETTGIYNTAGFNDDSRSLLSIPVRHDVWRRASANWLANLLVRGLIDEKDAEDMIFDLAVRLAKSAYHL